MACNAWNHPSNCSCGWGGVNYGGHIVFSPEIPIGQEWAQSSVSRDSYVDPNARCPVCGANVFFYGSPYGGRVFFDELGPPWTKHPCTDRNYNRVQTTKPEPARNLKSGKRRQHRAASAWQPLTYKKIEKTNEFVIFHLDFKFKWTPGKYIVLPSEPWTGVPLFWKWDVETPDVISVSGHLQDDAGIWATKNAKSPSWISSTPDFIAYRDNRRPTPKALFLIGQTLLNRWMQAQGSKKSKDFESFAPVARQCFELSAEMGLLAAHLSLSRIYQNGYGVSINEDLAAEHRLLAKVEAKGKKAAFPKNAVKPDNGLSALQSILNAALKPKQDKK